MWLHRLGVGRSRQLSCQGTLALRGVVQCCLSWWARSLATLAAAAPSTAVVRRTTSRRSPALVYPLPFYSLVTGRRIGTAFDEATCVRSHRRRALRSMTRRPFTCPRATSSATPWSPSSPILNALGSSSPVPALGQHHRQGVNGQSDLPTGGQETSPLTAKDNPRGGQKMSPRMASSARTGPWAMSPPLPGCGGEPPFFRCHPGQRIVPPAEAACEGGDEST